MQPEFRSTGANLISGNLFKLIFCIHFCALFFFYACTGAPVKESPISVEEAQKIALQFKGKYETAPPRGFGADIDKLVEKFRTISPKIIKHCSKPRRKLTNSAIRSMSSGFSREAGPAMLRRLATEESLHGDIGTAIRIVDYIPRMTNWKGCLANAKGEKAVFQADAGNYRAARKSMLAAKSMFDQWVLRGKTSKGTNKARTDYFVTRAQAAVDFARGDMQAAEIGYYQTLQKIDGMGHILMWEGRWRVPDAKLRLARALIWQGRLSEAEIWVREAIADKEDQILPHCFIHLSDIFFAQGRYEDARIMAHTAINMIIDRCYPADSLVRARARETLGRALVTLNRWDEALVQFKTIETEMKTDIQTFQTCFRGSPYRGLAFMMAGEAVEALQTLDIGLRQKQERFGADHYDTIEVEALSAMALAADNRIDQALERFRVTLPALLEKWRDPEGEVGARNIRRHKLELIMESYLGLLFDGGRLEEAGNALALAGALQTRSVARAISASAARATVADPELTEIIRQRQDLQLQFDAFKSRLSSMLNAPEKLQDKTVKEQLKAELNRVESALDALDKEVKQRFPRYAAIVNPDLIGIDTIRTQLVPGEAYISIFVGQKSTFVWALTKDGPLACTAVTAGRKKLHKMVAVLRAALDQHDVQTLADVKDFDVATAYRLYEMLLKPVEDGWKPADSLLVVANGPLAQLPLSTLPVENTALAADDGLIFTGHRSVPWLARTHAITVLPSSAALITLRMLPDGNQSRKAFAGFGDPLFNREQLAQARSAGQLTSRSALRHRGIRIVGDTTLDDAKVSSCNIEMLQRLPDTADEIRGIADALSADLSRDIFLGKNASEKTVKGMNLSDRRVLVFATHGLVPGDLDGLQQPALALSSPAVTGDNQDDGLLTMGEVMGLRLDADWVVLSACNTAAAEGAGAEAVSGLGQAFFYSGARSLLVTAWPVETTSARALTTSLFELQSARPELDRAEALRQAMVSLIDNQKGPGYSYAHPLFWAPFVLVGDGS